MATNNDNIKQNEKKLIHTLRVNCSSGLNIKKTFNNISMSVFWIVRFEWRFESQLEA